MNPLSWVSTALALRRSAPDVLLIAYWSSMLAPLCAVLRIVSGIRTVALLHNFTSHEPLPAERLFQKMLLSSADGFLTLSGSVHQEIEASGKSIRDIVLFHPVYEPQGPVLPKGDARRALGLPGDAKVLLFFGYVRRYKGLEELLDAMAIALAHDQSLMLVVAGEFIDDAGRFQAQAERLGISERVDFRPGYVPAGGVAELFAAADAVVLPYRSATQSGVVPLAYGHGVPVIARDAGGLSSQVTHGKTGWVVSRPGAEAFAEGILAFFSKREEMPIDEEIAAARRAMSWSAFARRATAFMETLVREAA